MRCRRKNNIYLKYTKRRSKYAFHVHSSTKVNIICISPTQHHTDCRKPTGEAGRADLVVACAALLAQNGAPNGTRGADGRNGFGRARRSPQGGNFQS